MARPRKPTEQKRREGTERPARANPDEPVYPAEAPPMPEWLSETARAEWGRLIPLLASQGVLAVTDLGIYAAYCQGIADLEAVTKELETADRYYKSGTLIKEHPGVKLSLKLQEQIKLLASELGLTPASRSKVRPNAPAPPSDPMAAPSPPSRRRPPVN
jgi:P27 family predicted phage terminase small subunit